MFLGIEDLAVTGWVGVLLEEATKASVVLALALGFTGLMRRSSAARRHLVLSLAVCGVLLMPTASKFLPSIDVALPAWASREVSVIAAGEIAGPGDGRAQLSSVTDVQGIPGGASTTANGAPIASQASGGVEVQVSTPSRAQSEQTRLETVTPERAATPLNWPALLFGIWTAGALVVLGRLPLGAAYLRWIENRSKRIKNGLLYERLVAAAERLGVTELPLLLQGDDRTIPMTWGMWRAVIILPVEAEGWEAWRIDAVLTHELGHVSRRDFTSQLAADVMCALHWFNPLAWIAAHRMRVEREYACDDLVVRGGHEPSSYAHELVDLARSLRPTRAAGAICFARPNRLRDRLLALLDDSRDRRPLTRGAVAGVAVMALGMTVPLAAVSAVSNPTDAVEVGVPLVLPASDTPTGHVEVEPHELVSPDLSEAESGALPTSAATPRVGLVRALAARLQVAIAKPVVVRQEAQVLCGPADGDRGSHMHNSNKDVISIDLRYGDCRTEVRIEGDIDFTEDFSAVQRMTRNARLRIEVRRPGSRHRMEIEPGSNGNPEYAWSVDGRDAPIDPAAEAWVENALVDVFRMTNFKAQERASWILAQRGPEGLFTEVEQMWADYAQSAYLRVLIADQSLSQAQIGQALTFASREIQSDHSLGQVLKAAADHASFGPETRDQFIAAAATIESDHTHSQVLALALSRDDLTLENQEALLESATRGIESDHQMAQILKGLVDRYSLDPALRPSFLRAAATLDSDHQKGQVYEVVLAQQSLNADELAVVLEAAKGIESDHQLAQLLIRATDHDLGNAQLRTAFLDAAGSIASDHNQAKVLSAALKLQGLDDADLASILSFAASIDSDHSLTGVLLEVADRRPRGPALRAAYLEAATSVESDHELGRALEGFIALDLQSAELIAALDVSRRIESDHTLSALLLEVLNRHAVEGEVRDAFLRALATVESESANGRVSSALLGSG